MNGRDGFNPPVTGLWGRFLAFLMILFLVAACSPGAKSDEDLTRKIGDLKKEVKAVQEKLDKLQAGQQAMLEQLKKSAQPVTAAPIQPLVAVPQPPAMAQPPVSKPLTVSQLLAGKDSYLGTRVTVKGPVGPIMVHHKSLFLKSPEGMVEVLFGKLPDPKLVTRSSPPPRWTIGHRYRDGESAAPDRGPPSCKLTPRPWTSEAEKPSAVRLATHKPAPAGEKAGPRRPPRG